MEVSSHVLWIVGGRLPLRGYRGPGPVRASVVLSQVLARSRGHTCRTLRGTGSVSNAILTIRKCLSWHVGGVPGATEVAVRACWRFTSHWGPPCSDDPVSSSDGDRGLGRWPRGHVKEGAVPDATGITPSGVCKEGDQGAGGRSPRKQEMRTVSQLRSEPTSHHGEHVQSQLTFFTVHWELKVGSQHKETVSDQLSTRTLCTNS